MIASEGCLKSPPARSEQMFALHGARSNAKKVVSENGCRCPVPQPALGEQGAWILVGMSVDGSVVAAGKHGGTPPKQKEVCSRERRVCRFLLSLHKTQNVEFHRRGCAFKGVPRLLPFLLSLTQNTLNAFEARASALQRASRVLLSPTSPGHDLWKAPHHTEQFHTDDVARTAGKPTFHAQTRTACRKSAVLSLRECRGSKPQDNRTHTVRAAIPPQTFPTHFRTTASSSSSHQIERSSRCTSRERPTARRGVLRLAPGADDHPVSPRTARAAPLV